MKKLWYGGRGSIGGVEKQTCFLTFLFFPSLFPKSPKTKYYFNPGNTQSYKNQYYLHNFYKKKHQNSIIYSWRGPRIGLQGWSFGNKWEAVSKVEVDRLCIRLSIKTSNHSNSINSFPLNDHNDERWFKIPKIPSHYKAN
jgi:hypothetical protein